MTFKNNNNARLTLGMQILRANQQIINLFGVGDRLWVGSYDQIKQFAFMVEWEDGQLAQFRPFIKLQLVDAKKGEYTELNYLEARKHIESVSSYRKTAECLFIGTNLWAQLLASCYDQLKLSPEESTQGETFSEDGV